MAKEYYEKLLGLVKKLDLEPNINEQMEVKHFFSGAALYIHGEMCATLSPVGLAFKLTEEEVDKLIQSGQAIPLKYFPKGHIKKGYALFENPDLAQWQIWKPYFQRTINRLITPQ